ncbi:MAG: RES family NAD+ phosphorylase [Bacteroidota bacterium]
MIEVWRITAPEYADTAFSGEGARLWGGRWGSEGRRLVYTAGSLSLALLEVLAGAGDRHRLRGYLAVKASFDEHHLDTLDTASLPTGWDARPYTGVSQAVGDRWLDEQSSLALRVPSVVVPTEWNVLLNPEHPAFEEIVFDVPTAAPFDPRLLG